MHRWKFLLTWLAYCALTSQVAFSQEDLCKPSFGYEKFIWLSEDTEIGSVVLTLDTAGSADDVILTLKDSDNFAFNASSQQLYVKSQLDADTTSAEPTYHLTINCREAGKQPVEISVVIRLGDVNDNPPKFDKDHYYTDLGETMSVGQTFDSQVVATDADLSFNNKAVYYTVQDGQYSNYFQFRDPLDSVLELRKALDYETLPNMTITVVATNELSSEKLSSTALLTIRVRDEDDLNPVFTSPLYEGVILENAATDSVVNVTPAIRAADADVTLDEPVVYSFHDEFFLFDRDAQGSQSVFQIDPDTAEVRLVADIRPTKVSIVVQATQKDNPSRYGVAMLVITVARVSSEAPRFQSDSYEVFVSEATPPGTTILSVSATDQDFGAAIRYSIVNGNTPFAITPYSGAINVTGTLDFETISSHTFNVIASDGNMDSTATVTVRVVDANDNTPVILDQQLSFQAERNQGDVITTIQAQDADKDTRLTFRLINYDSLFSINQSGTIRISADPTELTDSEYQLVVVVLDSGDPPREKPLSVTVKFPPLGVTQAPTVMAGPTDDTMAIALGVVAAVLLVVVIILLVYICRRRNQNSEQLDKARANKSPDPRGLKFKNANRGRLDHIHFQTDDCMDGATTVQENPLKEAGAFNYGFVHTDDPENDRNMDEIHIETAVIPYREADLYNDKGEMYQHEDSSDYGDSGSLPHKHSLANGLYPDTSTESLSTTHTNSSGEAGAKRQPLANGTGVFGYTSIGTTSFSTTPFGKQLAAGGGGGGDGGGGGGGGGGGSGDGANGMALSAMALDGLDPEVSVVPQEQKSELTVYF